MKLDPIEIPSTEPEKPESNEPTVEQRLIETEKELQTTKILCSRLLEMNIKSGLEL